MTFKKKLLLCLALLTALAGLNVGFHKFNSEYNDKERRAVELRSAWPTEREYNHKGNHKVYIDYSAWIVDRTTKIGTERNITGRLYEEFIAGGKKTMYFDMYLPKKDFDPDPKANTKAAWAAVFKIIGGCISAFVALLSLAYTFNDEF